MERLTTRTDGGLRDYDEICFINPNDPEGMYNLDEIVIHGNYETKLAIADRLAKYEDTGLSPEQVREMKEKQIPKPPVEKRHPEYPALGKMYYCTCGVLFTGWGNPEAETNFCGNCGQKLKGESEC